jgi:hypothetical protein
MLLLEDVAYISCGQILIFDHAVSLPGLEWSEQHYAQGFARQPSNVALRTLIEFGDATVRVWVDEDPPSLEIYSRVHAIPFEVTTGKVLIEGPEEINIGRSLDLPDGHYRLTLAQLAESESTQLVHLMFQKLVEPMSCSAVLLKDEDLAPILPLLESAATA